MHSWWTECYFHLLSILLKNLKKKNNLAKAANFPVFFPPPYSAVLGEHQMLKPLYLIRCKFYIYLLGFTNFRIYHKCLSNHSLSLRKTKDSIEHAEHCE